jgi:hypothetical protein
LRAAAVVLTVTAHPVKIPALMLVLVVVVVLVEF